jgi:formylglycine-generating enzyme required for sulfatase activity
MSDIFISYASEDRARAKVLAGALELQGWSVWWDRKIPPGRQFSPVIKEAIDEAKCIIVLWSKESVKSEWVQNEAAEGARREILVPALIDDVEIPFEFRRIQAAQLVDWEGRSPHLEFDTFLEAVCAILGQPLLPKASERIPDEKQPGLETEKAGSKTKKTKVLAAICMVALLTIISIVAFLKYGKPKTYRLTTTATAAEGSVAKKPDKASYNHGEKVTLRAVPKQGYSFTNWSGDINGSTNPDTLIMDADKSVTASFAQKTYSLTATAVYGSVTKSPDRASYNHDETVTLEAVPKTGYGFTNWLGDITGSANPATLVMDADKSVTASFALLKAGDIETNTIGMKLVYIPAGSFNMGSGDSAEQLVAEYGKDPESWVKHEFPRHEVKISKGFWMDQTEVTQGQYKLVMNDRPWSVKDAVYVQESPNNPAVWVTWKDAMEFCRKLSQLEGERYTYRLPTEAEWEYACRAGTKTRFSFGDSDSSLGDYAWFKGNASDADEKYAHSVRQKKSNPWGLYDMHGNVYEWCSDYYDGDYYSKSTTVAVDPNGPPTGDTRIPTGNSRSLRGGSWVCGAKNLRCSYRSFCLPSIRSHYLGFRVVRSQ